MTTRLSKIARLPAHIREQLNHRLHNGELGKTILPWLNELPETKKVLVKLFGEKSITHQNLSEWRYSGYQDWFLLQQRLQWCEGLTEQEAKINKNKCGDAYETMGWHFLFEISQALNALQSVTNPKERSARLQNLTREFARLQNAFNRSRRVHLEWNKYNDQDTTPEIEDDDDDDEEYYEEDEDDNIEETETKKAAEIEKLDDDPAEVPPSLAAPVGLCQESRPPAPIATPEPQTTPSLNSMSAGLSAIALATAEALAKADQPNCQPIPTLAPTPHTPATPHIHPYTDNVNVRPPEPPNPFAPKPSNSKYKYYSLRSILGRRFTCVEG